MSLQAPGPSVLANLLSHCASHIFVKEYQRKTAMLVFNNKVTRNLARLADLLIDYKSVRLLRLYTCNFIV